MKTRISGVLIFLLLVGAFLFFNNMKCSNKEGYKNDLSDLSGAWNVYKFTGSDFMKYPAGQVRIYDSGNSFDIILTNGSRKTVTISPQRTSKVVYGWVGPVGQRTSETIQFTFTPVANTNSIRGFMMDFTVPGDNEYILMPM